MVPFGVVGDQFGDLVLIEALAQLHGRFALGLAVYDAGERPVMANSAGQRLARSASKTQVSRRVLMRGSWLSCTTPATS